MANRDAESHEGPRCASGLSASGNVGLTLGFGLFRPPNRPQDCRIPFLAGAGLGVILSVIGSGTVSGLQWTGERGRSAHLHAELDFLPVRFFHALGDVTIR